MSHRLKNLRTEFHKLLDIAQDRPDLENDLTGFVLQLRKTIQAINEFSKYNKGLSPKELTIENSQFFMRFAKRRFTPYMLEAWCRHGWIEDLLGIRAESYTSINLAGSSSIHSLIGNIVSSYYCQVTEYFDEEYSGAAEVLAKRRSNACLLLKPIISLEHVYQTRRVRKIFDKRGVSGAHDCTLGLEHWVLRKYFWLELNRRLSNLVMERLTEASGAELELTCDERLGLDPFIEHVMSINDSVIAKSPWHKYVTQEANDAIINLEYDCLFNKTNPEVINIFRIMIGVTEIKNREEFINTFYHYPGNETLRYLHFIDSFTGDDLGNSVHFRDLSDGH